MRVQTIFTLQGEDKSAELNTGMGTNKGREGQEWLLHLLWICSVQRYMLNWEGMVWVKYWKCLLGV